MDPPVAARFELRPAGKQQVGSEQAEDAKEDKKQAKEYAHTNGYSTWSKYSEIPNPVWPRQRYSVIPSPMCVTMPPRRLRSGMKPFTSPSSVTFSPFSRPRLACMLR